MTATLPANRSFAYRTASLARLEIPGIVAGVLSVREGRDAADSRARESRYAVREDTGPDTAGRRFRVTKPGGAERYYVCLSADGNRCDCTGFAQYGRCKHAEALAALYEIGAV
jgi:hypothetical protein